MVCVQLQLAATAAAVSIAGHFYWGIETFEFSE